VSTAEPEPGKPFREKIIHQLVATKAPAGELYDRRPRSAKIERA